VSGRKAELVRRLSAAPKDETEELTELTVTWDDLGSVK
jgi:hypothetical protein